MKIHWQAHYYKLKALAKQIKQSAPARYASRQWSIITQASILDQTSTKLRIAIVATAIMQFCSPIAMRLIIYVGHRFVAMALDLPILPQCHHETVDLRPRNGLVLMHMVKLATLARAALEIGIGLLFSQLRIAIWGVSFALWILLIDNFTPILA